MQINVRLSQFVFTLGILVCAPLLAQDFYEIEQELIASDPGGNDHFGVSVDVDGNTAAVGAEFEDTGGSNAGAVYVYTKTGPNWVQQQKVTPNDPSAGKQFGRSVALDGDTLAVGAIGENTFTGAIYVFTRTAGVWSQQDKLVPSDAGIAKFIGTSVALDGDTIAAGSNGGQSATTSVAVFVRNAGVWSEQALLRASNEGEGDVFGISVAIDGDTVIVGGTGADPAPAGHGSGIAYAFVRSVTDFWSEQTIFIHSDAVADDSFGSSVAIDGDTAVIGARNHEGGDSNSGAAYIFERVGTAWSETGKLLPGDPAFSGNFGASCDIQGATIVVGAQGNLVGGVNSGAAYVYETDGGGWSEHQKLFHDNPAPIDEFGFSVAFDGTSILVGGRQERFPVVPGLAFVFARTAPTPPMEPVPPTPTPTATPEPSTEVSDWKLYD